MEIELKTTYGFTLIFKSENIIFSEDIETREYPKDENGKSIINLHPKRDIKTEAIEQIVNVLDDMIYHRTAEFDSTGLIERLFDKMPNEKAVSLIKKLSDNFEIND